MEIRSETDWLTPGGVLRHRLSRDGRPLGHGAALTLLAEDDGFGATMTGLIAAAPFAALFWETPPVTTATLDQPFEFILADAPALARIRPDPQSFAAHFSDLPIARFRSLGGDAALIAPCPRAEPDIYPHLASFLRDAPADQIAALWRAVGAASREELGHLASEERRWLSTSGLGVSGCMSGSTSGRNTTPTRRINRAGEAAARASTSAKNRMGVLRTTTRPSSVASSPLRPEHRFQLFPREP